MVYGCIRIEMTKHFEVWCFAQIPSSYKDDDDNQW